MPISPPRSANPARCARSARPMARTRSRCIVPCHRVIRSDGTLGGYGGGIENKKKLLAAEGIAEHSPELPLVD